MEQHSNVVIIGAGVSGLYCAWRLIEADPNRTVTIVERLDRTGGRLDSDLIEVKPGQIVREEEGGMRFNYDMHELMQLNHAMGLCDEIVPFPMSSSVNGMNTNRFHVGGRTFTADEGSTGLKTIWASIYDLDDNEVGKSPTDIVTDAYHAILDQNGVTPPDVQTPEFWTQFRTTYTWNGTPLNRWQLWGLLRDMGHSQECVRMLTETIGFTGPFVAPINAGDALQILADFPVDPAYFTFRNGFSTLPNAIEKRIADKVTIMLDTNVDRIDRVDDRYELTLTEAPGDQNASHHVPGGVTTTLAADDVIIAVATAGMERLFATSPALNGHPESQRLWDNIHSARGMKLMKINLYYDDAWWRDGLVAPPVESGPNFTNLPVNAVYPFYSLGDDRDDMTDDERAEHRAAALTIYCDGDNTNFWAGLQSVGPLFNSALQAKQADKKPHVLFAATEAVVSEATKQLATVFGITDVPRPVLTSYRLWNGEDDFEYAYHQWRLGVDDVDVRAYLAHPFDGVHFCNEAISDMQGWVNGSIRSSNLALECFDIDPLAGPACTKPEAETTPADGAQRRTLGLWGA